MRALGVVMNQEGLRDRTNLFQRLGLENLETFLGIGAIEPFHKRIFVGPMRGHTLGRMPRQSRNRISGEGKSPPMVPPVKRGSRSNVSCCGQPYNRKKLSTASSTVWAWKLALA